MVGITMDDCWRNPYLQKDDPPIVTNAPRSAWFTFNMRVCGDEVETWVGRYPAPSTLEQWALECLGWK